MKTVDVPEVGLGTTAMGTAFELVFGNDTLARVHGSSLRVSPWKDDRRTVKFAVDLENIPREVSRFLCGSQLRITTKQHRKVQGDTIKHREK